MGPSEGIDRSLQAFFLLEGSCIVQIPEERPEVTGECMVGQESDFPVRKQLEQPPITSEGSSVRHLAS
jgi:hypothetical protein